MLRQKLEEFLANGYTYVDIDMMYGGYVRLFNVDATDREFKSGLSAVFNGEALFELTVDDNETITIHY